MGFLSKTFLFQGRCFHDAARAFASGETCLESLIFPIVIIMVRRGKGIVSNQGPKVSGNFAYPVAAAHAIAMST